MRLRLSDFARLSQINHESGVERGAGGKQRGGVRENRARVGQIINNGNKTQKENRSSALVRDKFSMKKRKKGSSRGKVELHTLQ